MSWQSSEGWWADWDGERVWGKGRKCLGCQVVPRWQASFLGQAPPALGQPRRDLEQLRLRVVSSDHQHPAFGLQSPALVLP